MGGSDILARKSVCETCGASFFKRRLSRFCSKKCANKAWYQANKQHRLLKNKQYREVPHNRTRARYLTARWFKNNQEKVQKYRHTRGNSITAQRKKRLYHSNIQYRLRDTIRSRLNDALRKQGVKRSLRFEEYIGCTISQLKQHLESNFLSGMSWDNHGKYGWHIDHIKPLSSFDLSDIEQFKAACHYTNLQPLWASDNLSKGNKCEP